MPVLFSTSSYFDTMINTLFEGMSPVNLLPTGSRYMGASFSFSEIRTLYSSTPGQAIPSAFGHYVSAATIYEGFDSLP
jgi:hypothetical protein